MTDDVGATPGVTDRDVRTTRIKSQVVLISGQVLTGVGMGATFSAGALLMTQVSGSEAWSGMAATMSTVGAAIAAIPLAALAAKRGRAPALTTGALVAAAGAVVGLVASVIVNFPLLLLGVLMLGWGGAVGLQARFAAIDLSEPDRRGRDLAVVVWSTTVGAVLGPNLIQPADDFGQSIGLPPLTGPFVFSLVAQVIAAGIYLVGLRPDPLLLARRVGIERPSAPEAGRRTEDVNGVVTGITATALASATMVAVMSMTPVHLVHQGATLAIVGLTISLHVLGMFGLSPVFGILSDRAGREFTIVVGQVLLLAALLTTAIGAESEVWVTVGLVLLGLGWSASTVAGSTLVTESAALAHRTRIQGRTDLLQNSAAALGGGFAGLILSLLGYSGLALVAISLVVIVLATVFYRSFVLRGRTVESATVPAAD